MIRQSEKSMFKKKKTRTLGELKMLFKLLEEMQYSKEINGSRAVAVFMIDKNPKLLEI